MNVSADNQILDDIFINAKNRVKIGMRIENCKACEFPNLNIINPTEKGLQFLSVSAICGPHCFGILNISMYELSGTDGRGIVFDGVDTYGVTGCVFHRVLVGIKGVTTSYGVDFAKYVDGCTIFSLHVTIASSYPTAGVIFNSDSPTLQRQVGNNKIVNLVYEPSTNPQVVGNYVDLRSPNIISNVVCHDGTCRGHPRDLRILSWGVAPFRWHTIFESIAAYFNGSTGTGAASTASTYLSLTTGATSGSLGRIFKRPGIGSLLTFARRRKFRTAVHFTSVTNQTAYLISGYEGNQMVGFKIIDNTIYGITSDGTESTVSLQTISAGVDYSLDCHFTPSNDARFYVNGVDKGSITTHLPSAITEDYVIFVEIKNNAAEEKEMRLSYWDFEQEE